MTLSRLDEDTSKKFLASPDEQAADNIARMVVPDAEVKTEGTWNNIDQQKRSVPPVDLSEILKSEYGTFSQLDKSITLNIEQLENSDSAFPAVPFSTATNDLTVIIHGTWARNFDWWRPHEGGFWTYINGITGNCYDGPSPFSWSGSNRHQARVRAASELVSWAQAQTYDALDVICHSHGGNIAFLASHLGLKFRRLITLGTPMRVEYTPDKRNIDIIHNVYSVNDTTQWLGTGRNARYDGRTICDGKTSINYHANEDGSGGQPGHSDLHEEIVWERNDLSDKILKSTTS